MSHIIVGERIIGQASELIGHVMRGAGHFIEQSNGMVQELARHLPEVPYIVNRSIPDFSNPATYDTWQWSTLSSNYGEGSLLASNPESAALENAWKESIDSLFSATKDAALAIGSAVAGDSDSAMAYGAAAAEKFWKSDAKLAEAIWSGPTPGQGTCPLPGEGRAD